MGRRKGASSRIDLGRRVFPGLCLPFVVSVGQVLHSLLGPSAVENSPYLLIAMAARLLGLLSCGYQENHQALSSVR